MSLLNLHKVQTILNTLIDTFNQAIDCDVVIILSYFFKDVSIQINPTENYQVFHICFHKKLINGNIHTCISTANMSILARK